MGREEEHTVCLKRNQNLCTQLSRFHLWRLHWQTLIFFPVFIFITDNITLETPTVLESQWIPVHSWITLAFSQMSSSPPAIADESYQYFPMDLNIFYSLVFSPSHLGSHHFHVLYFYFSLPLWYYCIQSFSSSLEFLQISLQMTKERTCICLYWHKKSQKYIFFSIISASIEWVKL